MKALLIQPGDEKETSVVEIDPKNDLCKQLSKILECSRVERPSCMKKIYLKNGDIIEYELWVDEEGGPMCSNRDYNPCLTITSWPLAEAYGNHLYGPGIMIRKNKSKNLSLEDWKMICEACWYDEKQVEINVENARKTPIF